MKQLYLIRHAKSSWNHPDLSDIDRPLNKRGKRDAPFMGQRLASASICPDLMVSSPAHRARKTARIIAGEVGYNKSDILFKSEIYTSDLIELLTVIGATEKSVDSLALVGHNHVITECAEWLTGASIVNMPTSGIVAVEFAGEDWHGLKKHSGSLIFFDYPKLHESRGRGG